MEVKGKEHNEQTNKRTNYSDEHLNLFRNLCQMLVCPKCTTEGHKDHPWVLVSEVEQQHTDTLQTLVTQGRSKLDKSQEDSQALESVLSELQEQTDNAKGLITETFLSTGSPSSFLLNGRWLPNTKKKKSVSVPRCPRCDM